MIRLIKLFILIAVLSSANTALAQDPLTLNVTVTTKTGTVIRGLTPENFSVSVEKSPQKILSLSDSEVPVSVGVIIDTSGSQDIGGSKAALEIRKQFKEGLEGFFKKSNPANEYFAVAFNNKPELIQDWTDDYQPILQKLDSLRFGKVTSMYDALRLSIEKMNTSKNAKQVLILISDGSDNQSKTSFKQVRDLLKTSDIVLYSVGLANVFRFADVTSAQDLEGQGVLNELTSLSGGRVLFMKNLQGPRAFNEVFELIALELRSQYRIVIARPRTGSGKNWRKLKVTANRSGTSGHPEELIARTRQGY